jgi:hypothetical protein
MLVFMGSPVFVKKVWLCERGARANLLFVVRSIVEPNWAGPSLRTIFMDKNIVGYCGYIGLISFVAYRPDKGVSVGLAASRKMAVKPFQTMFLRIRRDPNDASPQSG